MKELKSKIIEALITIQLLGFRGIVADRRSERRAMKRILDADDQQIINFQ